MASRPEPRTPRRGHIGGEDVRGFSPTRRGARGRVFHGGTAGVPWRDRGVPGRNAFGTHRPTVPKGAARGIGPRLAGFAGFREAHRGRQAHKDWLSHAQCGRWRCRKQCGGFVWRWRASMVASFDSAGGAGNRLGAGGTSSSVLVLMWNERQCQAKQDHGRRYVRTMRIGRWK